MDSRMANNSAAYTEKPEFQAFQAEMQALYESFSGERGIFNREAVQKKAQESSHEQKRDQPMRRDHHEWGMQPLSGR